MGSRHDPANHPLAVRRISALYDEKPASDEPNPFSPQGRSGIGKIIRKCHEARTQAVFSIKISRHSARIFGIRSKSAQKPKM